MELYGDIKQGEKGAWLSIVAYIFLSLLKLIIGYTFNSEALLADGLNNSTDIVASIAVLVGLKISRKPPDRNHKYGHFRAETVAALIASIIMVVVGIQVLYQSFGKFFEETLVKPDMITAWTAVFSAGVMYLVYLYNVRLAKRINSSAIMATAQDNRSDALVSIGAFVGIIGSQLGWPLLDPIAAFIVGIIICRTAIHIFKDASHALTDGFDEKRLKRFKKTIESTPGVNEVKDIKARIHGNNVLLDVTIQVNSNLNVVQSHDISDAIEKSMLQEHQVGHVHIHVEPEYRKA
ncbi:cation diffusion facilitator family transporter [Cohnella herbarum]|uniref:Cation transporter n=1 Tax=Cohnella herbarum TaxID=2728023 RepID=A0A7Z2VIE5_9BACL|nr:cation diffusion facilitator family transporter [Cohnella herbarum]QJD83801.1 cation transporter [Cohnella herbarum]